MRHLIALLLIVIVSGCSPSPAPTPAPPAAPATATARPVDAAPEARPATAPTVPPSPPPTAAASASPKDELTEAFRGWGDTRSFRVRSVTSGLPGGDAEMNLEVVMPDRIHATRAGTTALEMIVIGDSAWMKLPTGWQKIGTGMKLDLTDPKKFEDSISASTESKLIGPDVLEGTPCLVYEYTTTLAPTSDTSLAGSPAGVVKPEAESESYTAKVWIAVADKLPRKVESGSPSSAVRTTITYYDYNAPITINPPV